MAANPKVQEPSMDEILASIRRIMADDEQPAPPRRPAERAAPAFRPEPVTRAEPAHRAPEPVQRRPAAVPDRDTRPAYAEDPGYAPRPAPSRPAAVPPAEPPPPRAFTFTGEEPARRPRTEPEPHPVEAAAAPRLDRDRVERELLAALNRSDPPPQRPLPSEAERRPQRPPAEERPRAAAPAEPLRTEPLRTVSPRPEAAPAPSARADGPQRRDLLSPGADAAVAASFQSLGHSIGQSVGSAVLPHKERTVEDLVKEILRPMLKDWLDQHLPSVVERLVRAEIERVSRQPR